MTEIGIRLKSFLSEEDGQDTMEYTLLLGFVAPAAAAFFPAVADSITAIWRAARNHLCNTASAAI